MSKIGKPVLITVLLIAILAAMSGAITSRIRIRRQGAAGTIAIFVLIANPVATALACTLERITAIGISR